MIPLDDLFENETLTEEELETAVAIADLLDLV